MELAVSVDVNVFDPGARRSSTWSHQVAAMSRRLESRWSAVAPVSDPAAHDLLGAYCLARAEHDAARFELAGQA